MNGALTSNENKSKAELAADFNEFYFQITSASVKQIGNYEVIEEIGEGAFGKVYLARHILLNMKVVLKCGLIDDPYIVREIYYHKQLRHRNIVKLYEVIKTEAHIWMVLEYCEGNELYYYIYDKKSLSFKECQRLFYQIVMGIKYVHSLNLSHRDLKLENILLADKKRTVAKLTDFGFVREFKRSLLSTVCGTTVYMAPEMLKGEKYSGYAVDIWSLGVILFTMLYGEMPFDEDDELKNKFKIINEEPTYKETIPEEAIALLKRLLSKNPNSRPSLNDILSSTFLSTFNDKAKHKRSDSESIVSINQFYDLNTPPFTKKIERNLLKKFQKLNLNTKKLENDINKKSMNSLTAFYELALTREFKKKKMRYKREKLRYYEARKSLKKSRQKVKSVLSLTDQTTQPLERIISGLSLSSRRPSISKSSEVKSEINPQISVSNSGQRLERIVSFVTDSSLKKKSNSSSFSDLSDKKFSNNKLLNKLQFWKKPKEVSNHTTIEKEDSSNSIISMNADTSETSKRYSNPTTSPLSTTNNTESATAAPRSAAPMRQRPESVVSQISQISQVSHLSQMSTMLSESELDILDETDTMDEDFEEDIYESSLNTSHDKYASALVNGNASIHKRKKRIRPAYRRALSSDISIATTSSIATKKEKRLGLTNVSSNSSAESIEHMILHNPNAQMNSGDHDIHLSPRSLTRSNSPDNIRDAAKWNQSHFRKSSSVVNPIPRSSSPPLLFKFNKGSNNFKRPTKNATDVGNVKKKREPTKDIPKEATGSGLKLNKYHNTINEEEEEDEKEKELIEEEDDEEEGEEEGEDVNEKD